jgi:hypothetical protein
LALRLRVSLTSQGALSSVIDMKFQKSYLETPTTLW